jgi:hypothetical protein
MDEIYAKSLQDLDGERWGDPPADATGLIEQVHRLRTVRLQELSLEELATLLGQREGSEWIVPLALDHLEAEPMAGDLYPGQLLGAVLHQADYWERFPRDLVRLSGIREDLLRQRANLDELLADAAWPRDI